MRLNTTACQLKHLYMYGISRICLSLFPHLISATIMFVMFVLTHTHEQHIEGRMPVDILESPEVAV